MLIKKAKYKKVRSWKHERISDEVYGCDLCKEEISLWEEEYNYLELNIFSNKEDFGSSRKQFCSWKCVLKYLPKIKSDYFVSLPYLYYDTKKVGLRAKDLIDIIK